ncbi:DUF2079 domain-containing protein [Amycolatopsis pittospori]|uniref:DUF2079 domain-containing protein n=1 Tax=Amycolatopsis pittospori TaxID=2749434 RepID=UPI0015F0D1DE|nr:DUF2079 domain-containing protein [Amycolatopsis pittospori]
MLTTHPPATTVRVWPLAAAFFVLYSLLSVSNHLRLGTTGFDLGIFEQIVRGYAEFRAPVSELKGPGFVMLGDHFHPILITLVPLYWIFPSPITLLAAQAGLLAISVIPVARTAAHLLGRGRGFLIGVAYGLSWGLQTAADFDFHEVVFAVPMIAFAIERLITREWTAAVYWAAPLLLVKEDLPLTFAALGVYLVVQGQRRLGVAVAMTGVGAFVLIVKVVIPAMNPAGEYGFAGYLDQDLALAGSGDKLLLIAAIFAPTAFLALLSPVSALVVPTLLWRLVSTNPSHWAIGFHYSAVLMPIVHLAMIHALGDRGLVLPPRIRRAAVTVFVVSSLIGVIWLPLNKLVDAATWRADDRVATAHRLMDVIPDDATVAASNHLAPQLTSRTTVQLYPVIAPRTTIDTEWVIADTRLPGWPGTAAEQSQDLRRLRETEYRTVTEEDGFVLLRRRPAG